MYSEEKVNFTAAEHKQAAKIDAGVETILDALGDGFQPLQDLAPIGTAAWAFIDTVRVSAKEWSDAHPGEKPTAADIALPIANYVLMLQRDNSYL
jgi:hypothetical protein